MKLSIYIHIDANSFYLFITSWHLYLEQISEITWSETGFSIKMLLYLLTVMTYYAVFLWFYRYLFYIYYISRSLFLCMNIFYETYFANIHFSFYPFRCGIKCVYVYANFYRVFICWCPKLTPGIFAFYCFFMDNLSGQWCTLSSGAVKRDKVEF